MLLTIQTTVKRVRPSRGLLSKLCYTDTLPSSSCYNLATLSTITSDLLTVPCDDDDDDGGVGGNDVGSSKHNYNDRPAESSFRTKQTIRQSWLD